MFDRLSTPKEGKRKALGRWNPFRQVLNRRKEKNQARDDFNSAAIAEKEIEGNDHSTVHDSYSGSNTSSNSSPTPVDDNDFLYSATGSPKSKIWEEDAKTEGSDPLVELSDGDSSCESEGRTSFTQLDVPNMQKEGTERSDDPSIPIDQGKRFVYRTSSARDKSGKLVMGEKCGDLEELGTEVVYFTSGTCPVDDIDGGSIIFDDDASGIFADDSHELENDSIFLSFEALGLLHSTGGEAESQNPLDSKAWDIRKTTYQHAFISSEMCEPIFGEAERHRLEVETSLALDCEAEFKALGLQEADEAVLAKFDAFGLREAGEAVIRKISGEDEFKALGLKEVGESKHRKRDEQEKSKEVGLKEVDRDEQEGLGCEAEFKALGLRDVGKARYDDDGSSFSKGSVVPPIPVMIETAGTPGRLSLDYQLSDDEGSIEDPDPTCSSSMTWMSHDEVNFDDLYERPVQEIFVHFSPARSATGSKSISTPSPMRSAGTSGSKSNPSSPELQPPVASFKEMLDTDPTIADHKTYCGPPLIDRVVVRGVGAATCVGTSNLFSSPFMDESESASESSLHPRTSGTSNLFISPFMNESEGATKSSLHPRTSGTSNLFTSPFMNESQGATKSSLHPRTSGTSNLFSSPFMNESESATKTALHPRTSCTSNLFTSPFMNESESATKMSMFPRTSPPPSPPRPSPSSPSDRLRRSPSTKSGSPPHALGFWEKNKVLSDDSNCQPMFMEFMEFNKCDKDRSDLPISTPQTLPPSKLAAKYNMESRLDLNTSPDPSHGAAPSRTRLSKATSAETSNGASRTFKKYSSPLAGNDYSPQGSKLSQFRFTKSPSRTKPGKSTSETSNGASRASRTHATSFAMSYSDTSFDDGMGCAPGFDNDYESDCSNDTEHEIVFSDSTFIQDISSELSYSFAELAREGSAVMAGLWSMK